MEYKRKIYNKKMKKYIDQEYEENRRRSWFLCKTTSEYFIKAYCAMDISVSWNLEEACSFYISKWRWPFSSSFCLTISESRLNP